MFSLLLKELIFEFYYPHFIFFTRAKLNKEAPSVTGMFFVTTSRVSLSPLLTGRGCVKRISVLIYEETQAVGLNFVLVVSNTTNMIYPGSDIKPEACAEVIS